MLSHLYVPSFCYIYVASRRIIACVRTAFVLPRLYYIKLQVGRQTGTHYPSA